MGTIYSKYYSSSTMKTSTPTKPPRVPSERKRFLWKIKDFDQLSADKSKLADHTLQFEAGAALGVPSKWQFYFKWTEFVNPYYESVISEKYIGIHLMLVEKPAWLENIKDMNVSFRLKIKNPGKEKGNYFCKTTGIMIEGDIGYDRVFDICANSIIRPFPLQLDKSVKIKLEFVMTPNQAIGKLDLPSQVKMFEGRSKEQLWKDLGNMSTLTGNGGNASTVILCKDGKLFPVMRGMLVVRSSVFQRMFANGQLTEAQTGLVKIDDLPSKAVEVMLHYIHTGKLHPEWNKPEVVRGLVVAADKYDLKLLLEFLGNVLGQVCSVENVLQLAVLANRLKMTRAEQELKAFINQNVSKLEGVKMETESELGLAFKAFLLEFKGK